MWALSNQPVSAPSAPVETAKADTKDNKNASPADNKSNSNINSQSDKTTNYEVDRKISHTQRQIGVVDRLSVAVIINWLPQKKEDGTEEMQPLPPEMIKEIESLTREAMGYSVSRGDSLSITNSRFTDEGQLTEEPSLFTSPVIIAQALEYGKILLLLLVGWLLWRKGIRPQWQRYRKAQQAEAEARMFKATQMKTPLVADDVISDDMDEKTRRRLTRQRVSAEIQSQRIREMADKDPQVVAMVISQWLGKAQ